MTYEPPPPLFPLDADEDSGTDDEGNSGESKGEIDASKTRSGKGYQNDDDDDDDPGHRTYELVKGKPLKDYEPPPPLFPLDEDEDSGSDNESDSDESEGEIAASKT